MNTIHQQMKQSPLLATSKQEVENAIPTHKKIPN
jgi:hypothetical protein